MSEVLSTDESEELLRAARRFVETRGSDFHSLKKPAGREERRGLFSAAAALGWPYLLATDQGWLTLGNAPPLSDIFRLIGFNLLPDILLDAVVVTPVLAGACGPHAAEITGPLWDGSRYVAAALCAEDERGVVTTDPFAGATLESDLLTGEKVLVRDGVWADGFVVGCRRESGATVLAYVASDARGVSVERQSSIDPMTAPARVRLQSAPAVVLAQEEQARMAATFAASAGRLAVVSEICGIADAVTAMSVEYAKTRVQFGRPIGSNQAVKHLLAELWRETYQADCVREETAIRVGSGKAPAEIEAASAQAKTWAGCFIRRSVEAALQIHAGIGFAAEGPLSRHYLRALTLVNAEGTTRDLARFVGNRTLRAARGTIS